MDKTPNHDGMGPCRNGEVTEATSSDMVPYSVGRYCWKMRDCSYGQCIITVSSCVVNLYVLDVAAPNILMNEFCLGWKITRSTGNFE